jgi:sulfotransferase family protein
MMPNFIIAGAARSGTTSLYRYLGQHPDIFVAPVKEPHYFAVDDFPERFTGPRDDRLNRRIIRDKERYQQVFAAASGKRVIGESSAFYLCYPHAAERIVHACSDPKIIIMLRDPVDRAYSAYMYLVRDGRETLSLAEALHRERERKAQGFEPMWWYTELSRYYAQVKHYVDVMGQGRVKILLYDDLCSNPGQLLRSVFEFLGVCEDVPIDTSFRYNSSGIARSRTIYTLVDSFLGHPGALKRYVKTLMPSSLSTALRNRVMNALIAPISMSPDVPAQLRTLFADDVSKLEVLLGRDLCCWRSHALNVGSIATP